MMDEEILTIREVADLLKLHPKTVNKFAISGKLPGLQDWSAVAVSEIGSPKSLREARYLRLDDCGFAIGAEAKCYFLSDGK